MKNTIKRAQGPNSFEAMPSVSNLRAAKNIVVFVLLAFVVSSCHDLLDEPAENKTYTEATDYTNAGNMILPLTGAYANFYNNRGWEQIPLIAVRGDDVNAGGLGDQQDFAETDLFNYNKDYWMYNSVWQGLYNDVFNMQGAMEQIELYREHASDKNTADQYIAEAKTIRAYLLFQLARVWGDVFIPESSDPTDLLFVTEVPTKDDVMQHISDQMDEAVAKLPAVHPNQRSDVRGGVTRYTALAVKALANLELKNYQAVADATSTIISSGLFNLETDYYALFKLKGKLNDENILELQYSDFGQGSGDSKRYNFSFCGPQGWTPKVSGAGDGWGFWEPSIKFVKFMLDRGETVRLETSVMFTDRGIAKIQEDAGYAVLPAWISNTTRNGDIINDYARALFASGKHYLPSEHLTPGRTDYGGYKNFPLIRYAEILLMYAEALTQGATGSALTADQAVNIVRQRAGLANVSGVTNAQVMDEKFAELSMELGTRYFDMIRLEQYNELSYDGRTFAKEKIFLPYPQNQVDQLPILKK